LNILRVRHALTTEIKHAAIRFCLSFLNRLYAFYIMRAFRL